MFPEFLPTSVHQLTEQTSINLAQKIQSQAILTSFSSQEIQTTYVCEGKGNPPILLLHGFDSSILEFRRLFPLLSPHQETLAVDLLGFGFTQRLPQFPLSPQEIKTHLYYFWKTVISQPIILVGASMGGAVALDFTLSYPEVVQKLVLLDSAGWAKNSQLGKLMIPPLGYLATELFLKKPNVRQKISMNAYYDQNFASPDALVCSSLHLEMRGWSDALIAFTKSGGYGYFGDQLSQIKQPSLIIWGENDRILGTEDALKFQKTLPHNQLIWISECGHVPHLEKAQITAEHILKFSQS